MNKPELIEQLSIKMEGTKSEAKKFLEAFEEVVTESLLANEPVKMVGFGNFEVADRAARMGRNPQTGEEMPILASKAPKFKPSKALKDLINQ